MDTRRNLLKNKQRVVIKIGSSSLQHTETGDMDYIRLEVLVRELCNLKNQGKDVVLVSSGAIAQGKKAVHLTPEQLQEHPIAVKQACAAVGQARLMMTYQKIFAEYNQVTAQILMTRQTISNDTNRINAQNTFEELFRMGVIPIVNENDTVATHGRASGRIFPADGQIHHRQRSRNRRHVNQADCCHHRDRKRSRYGDCKQQGRPDYPPDRRWGKLWNAVSGRKAGCLRSAELRREPAQLP